MQKTNFKTRLLALLTAAFMLVMCVPFAAFAEESKAKSITVSWADFKTDTMPKSVTVTENGAKAIVPHLEDGLSWYHGDVELVPDTKFGYEDVAAVANGDEFISFDAEEKPEVKKEVTVNINLSDPEAGYFTDNKEAKTLTREHLAADGKIKGLKNMVTANEGYEFTGWTWDGKGSGTLDVGATEFMYTDSAFYNGDATTGYVTLTAQFKKVEQPETQKHHFTVNFTVAPDKGSFTDYGAGPVVFQGYEEEVGGQQYNVPAVTAKEGYKFVGWKGQDASEIAWGADAKTFCISGLCFYQDGSYKGNASIEAQFEEVKTEPEVKKTVSVTIATNNEQGIFPDYDGQEVIHFDNLDPNTDQQFELPKVEAKPGYEFIGWHVKGNEVGAWDADAKTFGITGLAHFEKGPNVGYLTIAAVYKAKTERTVEVTFSVDPDKGEFEKNDLYTSPAANVKKLTATEFDGTQYAIPTVKAKAGYKFVGWKGQGADVIAWNAEAKTFGVTGLCFFNGDDATTGYATVEAVFEKIEDKKNDNSSSSSSASSSSNKTTTASSKAEQKVVKAAAAPANTTKVLPKTGASNVAPLLGGSLAVVALLMGYGVYGLVLRKKD